jgi:hypothetical protein
MPGYSGTPLAKKLGIKDGWTVFFVNAPAEVLKELKPALATCKLVNNAKTSLDFAMVFTTSQAKLQREFKRIDKSLTASGMLWISWPKKTSGVATDVNENVVREIGLAAGLVDVKVCAVTEVWSGLKFVRRVRDREVAAKEVTAKDKRIAR